MPFLATGPRRGMAMLRMVHQRAGEVGTETGRIALWRRAQKQ